MTLFICKCGEEIQGTLEEVTGRADADLSLNAGGEIEYEHSGYTEIFWDEQNTVGREEQTVFLCYAGCEVLLSEIIVKE